MNLQLFNQGADSDHITRLKTELTLTPWGTTFLDTLERSEYPVLPMPDEIRRAFPNSPALLNFDPLHTIFLTPEATADNLCHEIRHVEQTLSMPDELIECDDIKHRFIFHAFMEADAYAHQAAMFIQMLVHDPQKRAEEMEIFKLYNDPDSDIMMEPIRTALYVAGGASPDEIVNLIEADPNALKKMMSFVFSWAMHEIIPKQYEERHLDAVDTAIRKNPESFKRREAKITDLTEADTEFFAECIHNFGSIITDCEESYLIDENGYGPDLCAHLEQIITPAAALELERLNMDIPYGNRPASPDSILDHG